MNQQTLVCIREEMVDAMFLHIRSRGQLDLDESVITVRHVRRRRVDEFVDEVTGEQSKHLINDDPVRGYNSASYKSSSVPLPYNAFFHTKITRSLNMLPEHQKSLALFAYQDQCEWCHIETVSRWLWVEFLNAQSVAFREKKEKQLKGMVFLAMQNWKENLLTGRDEHEPAKVRELLGVGESNWRRDWLPFWRQFHDLLSSTDTEVLTHVYRSTQKTRADSRDTEEA